MTIAESCHFNQIIFYVAVSWLIWGLSSFVYGLLMICAKKDGEPMFEKFEVIIHIITAIVDLMLSSILIAALAKESEILIKVVIYSEIVVAVLLIVLGIYEATMFFINNDVNSGICWILFQIVFSALVSVVIVILFTCKDDLEARESCVDNTTATDTTTDFTTDLTTEP